MGWSSASHSIWTPKPLRWFPLRSSNVRFSFLLRTEVRAPQHAPVKWHSASLWGIGDSRKKSVYPKFHNDLPFHTQLEQEPSEQESLWTYRNVCSLQEGRFSPSQNSCMPSSPKALALSSRTLRCPLVYSELHECWQHSPVRWQVHSLPGSKIDKAGIISSGLGYFRYWVYPLEKYIRKSVCHVKKIPWARAKQRLWREEDLFPLN